VANLIQIAKRNASIRFLSVSHSIFLAFENELFNVAEAEIIGHRSVLGLFCAEGDSLGLLAVSLHIQGDFTVNV